LSEAVVLISSWNTGRQELIKFVQNISDSHTKILGIIPREENSDLEKHINILEQYRFSDSLEQDAVGAK